MSEPTPQLTAEHEAEIRLAADHWPHALEMWVQLLATIDATREELRQTETDFQRLQEQHDAAVAALSQVGPKSTTLDWKHAVLQALDALGAP